MSATYATFECEDCGNLFPEQVPCVESDYWPKCCEQPAQLVEILVPLEPALS